MKKVLITGAGGFIGSHLTELLLENGYFVRSLVHYNSFNFRGWLEDVPNNKNLEIVSGDVRDPHFCKDIIKNIDTIFHLAALIAIPYSYYAPDSYIETNVKGTLNICQAAREAGGIRVIHTSTSEVYGTAQYIPIDEKHPKQPQSPYSASKIGADAVAMSFYNAFNLPVTVARPFNTYGPRQSARAIIPAVIIQIASGIQKIKVGDVRPTRDFNYVKDTCKAFMAIAETNLSIGKEINISSSFEISIDKTLSLIREIMECNVEFITDRQRLRPDNSEVFRLCGNNNLLFEMTGFKPQTDVRSGIELTCEWFTRPENLKKYKAEIYNI